MRIGLAEHFTFKKLLKFVAPSIIMMVFLSVYSVVDGLFVSNFVGSDAVAAINYIFPVFMVFGSIGFMLGTGGSALVSKTLGEGDKEKANEYFSMLVYVTAGIGVVIAVAGQFAVPEIAKLFGAEGEIYDYCVLYGRVLLTAQPFFILQNIFQSFFVTAEKPRLGLIVTAVAGGINIVLDAVFVAGFKWGLAGASAATVAGQVFGGVFPLVYFARKNNSLLKLGKTKIYFKELLKSCTNGSSEFLSNVSSAVVIMLYNYQVAKLVGDDGVAAYGAIGYVMMIFFSVFMGYAVGSAPLIAFNFGARNDEELKNLFKKSVVIMTVSGVLMTGLSEALASPVIMLFGFDGELFEMTLRGFRIYSVAFLITGFSVFGSSLFTALNNGLVSAVISFLRTLVFQIAAVMVCPIFMGLDGVWAATCFAEILALAVTVICIFACRKKYRYF
ncbi:MAG: MATE family efflux transporter [Clostridia bacterium]|nr:MATE family efflux transporter [Clostridia bacterium]MDE7214246.1 MATE family efflux transporter [Clostridia bacterium]